jgi:putative ABC transport system substrate-binding protein
MISPRQCVFQNPQPEIRVPKFLLFLAICGLSFALSRPVEAQQGKNMPRIGFLGAMSVSAFSDRLGEVLQGLHDLGYVEGKNIAYEYRWADGKLDRLPDLAAELVRLKVDVIVTFGGLVTATVAKKATSTIPIVMATGGSDPVRSGLVASLARPGGNLTGLSNVFIDVGGKHMELLKEVVPKLSRLAVIWSTTNRFSKRNMEERVAAAQSLRLKIQSIELRGAGDIDGAIEAAKKGKAGAVLVSANPFIFSHLTRIAELTVKHRLPAIHTQTEFAEAGGLLVYGPSDTDIYRRAAVYVGKILKGAKPADLPIERPTKFELVINLKTAKQIGLSIPPNVLARADRVIR